MSQENVELVRRIYEAAARRDSEAVLALYDPDVELDSSRTNELGSSVYRGHEGLRKMFREWHEAWENIEYDYEHLEDMGDHVIATVTRRARGRTSGVDVKLHVTLVWTISEAKVVQVVWFRTRDEVLEHIGHSK